MTQAQATIVRNSPTIRFSVLNDATCVNTARRYFKKRQSSDDAHGLSVTALMLLLSIQRAVAELAVPISAPAIRISCLGYTASMRRAGAQRHEDYVAGDGYWHCAQSNRAVPQLTRIISSPAVRFSRTG